MLLGAKKRSRPNKETDKMANALSGFSPMGGGGGFTAEWWADLPARREAAALNIRRQNEERLASLAEANALYADWVNPSYRETATNDRYDYTQYGSGASAIRTYADARNVWDTYSKLTSDQPGYENYQNYLGALQHRTGITDPARATDRQLFEAIDDTFRGYQEDNQKENFKFGVGDLAKLAAAAGVTALTAGAAAPYMAPVAAGALGGAAGATTSGLLNDSLSLEGVTRGAVTGGLSNLGNVNYLRDAGDAVSNTSNTVSNLGHAANAALSVNNIVGSQPITGPDPSIYRTDPPTSNDSQLPPGDPNRDWDPSTTRQDSASDRAIINLGGSFPEPVVQQEPVYTDDSSTASGGGGGGGGGGYGVGGGAQGGVPSDITVTNDLPPGTTNSDRQWVYIGNGIFENLATGERDTHDDPNDNFEVGETYSRGDQTTTDPRTTDAPPDPSPRETFPGAASNALLASALGNIGGADSGSGESGSGEAGSTGGPAVPTRAEVSEAEADIYEGEEEDDSIGLGGLGIGTDVGTVEGEGEGEGEGAGDGQGYGQGYGQGDGQGYGQGDGQGDGDGDGDGDSLDLEYELPAPVGGESVTNNLRPNALPTILAENTGNALVRGYDRGAGVSNLPIEPRYGKLQGATQYTGAGSGKMIADPRRIPGYQKRAFANYMLRTGA